MNRLALSLTALALAASPLVACSDDDGGSTTTDTTGGDSVYAQLGGQAGITTFVDGLVAEELMDPTIAPYFAGLGLGDAPTAAQLKACLVQQIGNATGGPEQYPTTVNIDGGFTCRCDAGGYHVTYTFKAGEGENALPVLVSIVDDEH